MEDIIKKIYDYSLEDIMGQSFGRYSKYIIQDRAIPDVRDGLKSVQRRILYSMYKERNTYDKPTKKSANAVGLVMANYHPHGDSSIYEAIVRMSQWWKNEAPLIEMQGNNGSIDGDSPAAYRYTEARLSKISNELLKYLYQDKLKLINQNINTLNTYNEKGIRIKNGYDFLNAIFLLICLIINLIFRNCLLIFTIPFGIYSLITIYSFFETNFFNKGRLVSLKNNNYNLVKMIESKSTLLKKEISKTTDMINFIKEQKLSTLTKLPSTFNESIDDLIIDNEQDKAKVIFESLESNNMALFNSLLSENTNFTLSIINEKLKPFTFEDDLEDYANKKEEEKKSNQSEIIVMKKIKKMDMFLLTLTLFISAFSIVFIKENIKSYDLLYLIIGTFIGILSILIYNINTGKHKKVFDTFLDNLLFCVFNSSLIYDILYLKDYQFRFIYVFIMIPLTFMFMYMGISMLISIIKYKYLLKRLSK